MLHVGQEFDHWTVIDPLAIKRRVFCRCKCGTERRVLTYSLTGGDSHSCGCREMPARTHGESRKGHWTPEYRAYVKLRERCLDPNNKDYAEYGGRGITVEWPDFQSFLASMNRKPTPAHSVERRDNNGPYSADNCYWATPEQQARNRRNSRYLALNGRTQLMVEWTREFGWPYSLIATRIRQGWSEERALSTPYTPGTKRKAA